MTLIYVYTQYKITADIIEHTVYVHICNSNVSLKNRKWQFLHYFEIFMTYMAQKFMLVFHIYKIYVICIKLQSK